MIQELVGGSIVSFLSNRRNHLQQYNNDYGAKYLRADPVFKKACAWCNAAQRFMQRRRRRRHASNKRNQVVYHCFPAHNHRPGCVHSCRWRRRRRRYNFHCSGIYPLGVILDLLLRKPNIARICLSKGPAALSSSVADASASPPSSSAQSSPLSGVSSWQHSIAGVII